MGRLYTGRNENATEKDSGKKDELRQVLRASRMLKEDENGYEQATDMASAEIDVRQA